MLVNIGDGAKDNDSNDVRSSSDATKEGRSGNLWSRISADWTDVDDNIDVHDRESVYVYSDGDEGLTEAGREGGERKR